MAPSSDPAEQRECFDLFDADGDGRLTRPELGVAVRSLGHTLTGQALAEMHAEIGPLATFDEFKQVLAKLAKGVDTYDDLMAAFKVFDRDSAGSVPETDLRHILTSVGDRLSQDEFDEILRSVEMQPGSNLRYQDFVRMMKPAA
mmetsp:Transcript_26473/g.59947  ORF Transcript_26473/g.59947 Transcript_26473/m.59947 type:complete len:144 (+) Transcript_26473:1295-1726(+)|eukprot:CAMPEP_0204252742 /NCGR_PEP_ID=MMETSP0468-20130131/1407_1 /ASSEMBLY_ACC=CAM_ASM_000383 /TAXON_ID=2969 /ORGANISM="Oxyrrhis marina" /LENGTH=143 /DNA_ID=CAMNT_0051226217 /DNA_START=25 /DNA_END=456 /DNA_ORIENTATION=-